MIAPVLLFFVINSVSSETIELRDPKIVGRKCSKFSDTMYSLTNNNVNCAINLDTSFNYKSSLRDNIVLLDNMNCNNLKQCKNFCRMNNTVRDITKCCYYESSQYSICYTEQDYAQLISSSLYKYTSNHFNLTVHGILYKFYTFPIILNTLKECVERINWVSFWFNCV
jgi:hypothetical protein